MSAQFSRQARIAGNVGAAIVAATIMIVLFALPPVFGTSVSKLIMPPVPYASVSSHSNADASVTMDGLPKPHVTLTSLNSLNAGTYTNETVSYNVPVPATGTLTVRVGKSTILHLDNVSGRESYTFRYTAPKSVAASTQVTMTATATASLTTMTGHVTGTTTSSTTFTVTPPPVIQ